MNNSIKRFLAFLALVLPLAINVYSQKNNAERWCDKNKKTNNFIAGDTLYSNCNYVIKPDSVSYDDFDSPLLDSLVVCLKRSPEIIVVLNNWQPVSKEVHNNQIKRKEYYIDTTMVKFTYVQANHIEAYLIHHGVQNCIFSIGKGHKIYDNDRAIEADGKCAWATQIILTNRGVWHCIRFEENKPVIMQNIYFDVDKWELLPASQNELDLYAAYLKSHPKLKIEISGHTDNTGDAKKNLILSQKRAEAVAAYLKSKFVKNTIVTKGYGSSKPLRTNNNEIGRAQNRRIEVRVIK